MSPLILFKWSFYQANLSTYQFYVFFMECRVQENDLCVRKFMNFYKNYVFIPPWCDRSAILNDFSTGITVAARKFMATYKIVLLFSTLHIILSWIFLPSPPQWRARTVAWWRHALGCARARTITSLTQRALSHFARVRFTHFNPFRLSFYPRSLLSPFIILHYPYPLMRTT